MKKSRKDEKRVKPPNEEKGVLVPGRLGFLKGQFEVPDDFDRMAEDEIAELFGVQRSRRSNTLAPSHGAKNAREGALYNSAPGSARGNRSHQIGGREGGRCNSRSPIQSPAL